MQKYYQNKPKFNSVYSINNLPKIKDIKEIKNFIANKNIIKSIYRVQANNSIMCEYLCIGFNDFMLKGKSQIDYTNLFSPNDYEKNDKVILKYFIYFISYILDYFR